MKSLHLSHPAVLRRILDAFDAVASLADVNPCDVAFLIRGQALCELRTAERTASLLLDSHRGVPS